MIKVTDVVIFQPADGVQTQKANCLEKFGGGEPAVKEHIGSPDTFFHGSLQHLEAQFQFADSCFFDPPARAAGGLGRSIMLAFSAREMKAKVEGIEPFWVSYPQGQNLVTENGFSLVVIINPGYFLDLLPSFGQAGGI